MILIKKSKIMATFLKSVKNSVKHWYLTLIIGIIFLGVGIVVFFTPLESYLALSIIFSVAFLLTGLLEIAFSISNRNELEGWGWHLALGIVTLLVGIMLVGNPAISMVTLPFFVGFVVLFRSIMAISTSLELRNYYIMDWGYLFGLGILGTIFSFMLLFNPSFAGLSLVIWTGLALVLIGIFSIYLSLKLKKLKDIPKTISAELKSKWNQIQSQITEEMENRFSSK
jgi:uncharacterized membrane protein HdeD (DUF308 family)